LDLMRDVRARGIDTPVIFLTGRGDEEVAVETMKLGAADYVLKDHLARLGPAIVAALQGPRMIAYLSMEIALESAIPTYSGGLGILAGDTVRAAADLRVPMAAVSLLYRNGYFNQRIDPSGWQIEEPARWDVSKYLHEMRPRAAVTIEGRNVVVRAWRYSVRGQSGYVVPVYLLDTDLPENTEWDRGITRQLYSGDWYLRLCQEVVLGMGGVHILRALGYRDIERFHMNEGHASFLVPALLLEDFTIGFARRFTPYKRPDLLFIDIERLRKMAESVGRLQVLCAGKAHPHEHDGKLIIQQIFRMKAILKDAVTLVFIPNYDLDVAKRLVSGVDLWLNTPQPPFEASGTSGMKAALNGIPSLSILDGWWIEGHIEGVTGWSIGEPANGGSAADRQHDAASLYQKLEQVILPTFYRNREHFLDIMRNAIAINGSFFNTQRMLQQYALHAYY
jgi:glucan phosphorylase